MSEVDGPESPAPTVRPSKIFGPARLIALVRRLRGPIVAFAAFGAVLSGLVGYWNVYRTVRQPAALPAPSRSIEPASIPPSNSFALLPFSASTADPDEVRTAEALSAELASSLQRGLPDWSVPAYGLAAAYKEKPIDARAAGRELHVRYLVEGAYRAAGPQGEVKVWLTETTTGNSLWNSRLALEEAGEGKESQLLVSRLTNQIKGSIHGAAERAVFARPVAGLNAWELTVRADAIQRRDGTSLSVLSEARSLYERALRLNPDLPSALMGKALAVKSSLDLDRTANRDQLIGEYDTASARLVIVAADEARTWNIRADALQQQWRWEAALEANARAQQIDPTRTNTLGQRATLLLALGQSGDARALVDRAFSLRPADVETENYLLVIRCRAHLALGHYDDAISDCEKASSLGDDWWTHMHLAAAYALRGIDDRAKAEKAKLLAQRKGFCIEEYRALQISGEPEYLRQTEAHLFAGLRRAGIPER